MPVRIIRDLIYTSLGFLDSVFGAKQPAVVVICYHGISDDGWYFSVKKDVFENQINNLAKTHTFITAQDLYRYLYEHQTLPKNAVLLTFDDGYEDLISVSQFLKEKQIKPLLFVLSDSEHVTKDVINNSKQFLSTDNIKQLVTDGWDIGSHSATHEDLTKLNELQLDNEIKNSKIMLENTLQTNIKFFSYPKGRYDNQVLNKVKQSGYEFAFTMDDALIDYNTDKFLIPRIGVDATHNNGVFKYLFSPSVIRFRAVIKKLMGNKLDQILNI